MSFPAEMLLLLLVVVVVVVVLLLLLFFFGGGESRFRLFPKQGWRLTLREPQSRFGDKPLKFQVVCLLNGTAVL